MDLPVSSISYVRLPSIAGVRGSGRVHGGGMMLVGTGLVALLVGSLLGQDALGTRLSSRAPFPSGGITASIDGSLADMVEVWGATEGGDTIPFDMGDGGPAPAPVPGASASPTLYTRIAKPDLPPGPRRVGIQAGHWETDQAPPELRALRAQTGTSWDGVKEVDVNLDVANRIKAILEPKGIVVDVLPTIIPRGYVADAVVALHGDGDGTGDSSGFKMAYSSRRTPFESDLLDAIKASYGAATGLAYDPTHISRAMTNYYLFTWQRNAYSTYPLTPSVILEMGYVSNDNDRALMTDHADVVAGAIANGITGFLDTHPRSVLFGQDLLVPATPLFRRSPRPTPAG